ncbi:fimbrial protein [Serratia sp. NA_13]|uniref:fimbrial protein n=1 Tax=Serratia sp. NA_13 TaxID=3415658 RepID=UPI004046D5E8
MMLKISIIMLSALILSPNAEAACKLARGSLTKLSIPSQVIRISADAPVSTSNPLAQFDSPTTSQDIGFDDCIAGTPYGKRTINLRNQNPATKIFPTNIPGIGIRVLARAGDATGDFPSSGAVTFPGGEQIGTFDIKAGLGYRIQIFKTGSRLSLQHGENTFLPAGLIAYNYLGIADPAYFTTDLTIGEMKITSTPACTCTSDKAKTVNFNDITPSQLKNGVTRKLNFAIVCKSDFGSYSAKASIITATPSSDASYIRAKDAAGKQDRLGIKITDSAGKTMKVDGSTSEQKTGVSSLGPAEFAWNATLFASSQSAPTGGVLSAKAEIVFDIQ